MRFKELLQSFLSGFFRWMGVGVALLVLFAFFAAISNEGPMVKVRALAPQGFETVAWAGQPSIAVLRINDTIGSAILNREKMAQILETFQSGLMKGKIRAILLEIDSGGGGVIDSEAIFQLISRYKALYKLPIYAYIDGYCASGGFLIACASDKIVATDYSVVGSVGVIGRMMNYSSLLEKLGVKPVVFMRGEGKDALDPMQPFEESDRAYIEPLITADYHRFLTQVHKARPLLTPQVLEQLGARIYPAEEAKRLGYIDEVGFDRSMAVQELANLAGLTPGFALIEVKLSGGLSEMFVEASYGGVESFFTKLMANRWKVWLN